MIIKGPFYENGGSDALFGELFAELAKKFPTEKVQSLKILMQCKYSLKYIVDKRVKTKTMFEYFFFNFLLVVSCKIQGVAKLKEANTAGDCFMLLWEECMFTPSDVIAIQYLLQMTECHDLQKKCVEYAEKKKAWYYLEKPAGKIY